MTSKQAEHLAAQAAVPAFNTTEEGLSADAERWLTRHVAGYAGPAILKKFPYGQSNPTYRLCAASGDYVLRRKPFGNLLPKAHAIEREFRVLSALANTDVPVPRVYAFCEDSAPVGAPFYVMDFLAGRIFYDQTLPGLSAGERAAIFDNMNAVVARLHSVDPAAAGLERYGRPDKFLARQIALWTQQYRASEGDRTPAMESLIEWLPRNIPAEQQARIFHGDLRLDNMIFHPTRQEVIGLLDWELSTLGDPVADFAYNAMQWRVGPKLFRGLEGLDFAALGIPDERTYVRRYCERVGRPELQRWNFYLAFGLFRVAAILQGVWRRAMDGNASAADAREVGSRAAPLAAIAWTIAQELV
jgi:aminoglycoside phosphotransferase (APT) family kinase protein